MTTQPAAGNDDWVQVSVRDPLPLHTAAALTRLLGSAWPDARMGHTPGAAFTITIPTTPAKRVTKKTAQAILDTAADETGGDVDLVDLSPGSLCLSSPQAASRTLSEITHSIMDAWPETVDHLDWAVTAVDGHRYQVSIDRLPRSNDAPPGHAK